MQAFILLGAPGTGKGTAAEDLVRATQLIHLSTGDMLRAAIKAGSEVGRTAQSYMEKGALVPDEVIIDIVRDRLAQGGDGDRYLFDGFPRTQAQATKLDAMLGDHNASVNGVFLLDLDEEIIYERIEGRRICRQCGAVYHVTNLPPAREGICDQCEGELYQRKDDNRETISNRLAVYHEQTEDLVGYYEARGVLQRVSADGPRHDTRDLILSKIEATAPGS